MKFNKIFALYISFFVLLTSCSYTSSESAMTYTGSVEADEIIINSEVSGTIENIIINEGDFVKANTLLLSINHEDLDLELKQLENKKAIASLEMTQLLEGSRADNLWVKIYISDLNLSNIQINSTAKLYGSDGLFKGTGIVKFISNKAEFTPQNIESKENRAETVFEVNLDIDNSNGDLKSGMLVDVIFQEE